MERLFGLRVRGTTVATEVLAGTTTFISMAYVIPLFPNAFLKVAGIAPAQGFTAFVVCANLSTLIGAFYANLPIAFAAGMGLSAFFAFTVCASANQGGMGSPSRWPSRPWWWRAGWPYGSNFFNVDMLTSDKQDPTARGNTGANEVYVVYRGSLSLGKLSGKNLGFGPVRDVSLKAGFDFNPKNNAFASMFKVYVGPGFEYWNNKLRGSQRDAPAPGTNKRVTAPFLLVQVHF